jgi:thiamine biosynthesis lipoprotein
MGVKLVFEKELFGKSMLIELYSDEYMDEFVTADIVDGAYAEALRLQKIFNIYDASSELSVLNRKRKLSVSRELHKVLMDALKLCKQTDGMYDISLGKNMLQRKAGKELSKISCSYMGIMVDGSDIKLMHPDILIDLGSIAKGYITDRIVEYLQYHGIMNGMIDSRGDIRFFGESVRDVGIQHPRIKSDIIKTIRLKDESVATSGDYNQYSKTFKKSHILNSKDVISATVVAKRLELADGLATALFVCDSDARKQLLKEYPDVMALTIDKDFNIEMYNGFEKILV